ncbi:MAG: UvrD-helicase domain-containing protein [Myxococcaceae bacterium]|nr:UvrD-helicase domain-containing protein [Myxococcaceae bacterium]MCA3014432.1 UvrD-helicase domain-containing protein [Myxococcaceae bacterium]
MTKTPADQAARARLREDLDTTFVVEAAAGTGKTTELVERVVALVRRGRATLDQLISVTFTEKAAGEMKLRLRDRLERARHEAADDVERARLVTALEQLEAARIGTIHGLCADLLREYPVEAGVDPLFEVAAGGEAEALAEVAFTRCFQQLLETQPEGLRRALRRRARGPDRQPPRRVLLEAAQALIARRDFDAPWSREPFDRHQLLDDALDALRAFTAHRPFVSLRPGRERAPLLELLDRAAALVAEVDHREVVSPRDHDGLEASLRELAFDRFSWGAKPFGLVFSGGRTEASLAAARDEASAALIAVARRCDADLAALLREELRPVLEAYELEKARAGVLDFVDLLLRTRELLRCDRRVRGALQQRFTHVFVDEFQDTDPLQSDIVLLLSASDPAVTEPFEAVPVPGKLFVVGDPKQSIYRFRRADILLYARVKAHLVAHGARVELLSTSFRSTPGLQGAVNSAFEAVMTGGAQADYVPLAPWREATATQPSIVALPAPRPFSPSGRVTKAHVEACVPDAVGAFVEWLVTSSGWTVEEDGQRVPVAPRHVCVLFKRLKKSGDDVARPYAAALEARKVPHVLVGGRSFHQREEVMALRTALVAVDRPDDELSVYGTLKGPLFALPDELLLAFKHAVGKLHPLRPFDVSALPAPAFADVVEALGVLRALHLERNRRPVASTLHALLEATRAHAGIAFWRGGAQALANALQLGEVSRRYERRATSFREVVEALVAEADAGEAPEAPLVEEGVEGVRMMTVHTAKGLEFPVVVLAEPTAPGAPLEPSHVVDPAARRWAFALAGCVPLDVRRHERDVVARDAEEAVRLAYVAATRARELLVVPVCSEKQWPEAWTQVLAPALWPKPARAHEPQPAPGCPAFGRDVIVDRQGEPPPGVPLPGLHAAQGGRNRVTWFDPRVLSLGREEVAGLEGDEALRDDDAEAPRGLAAFEAWRQARQATLARGAEPARRVCVARELPPTADAASIDVQVTQGAREGRPGGRRFGELVHACLATVALDADDAAVERVAEVMGRALEAPAPEVQAAREAVWAALAHPLVAGARQARRVRREAPIVDHLPDGTVVEGVIDLAWEGDDGWLVVEFKTDDALDERLAAYQAQTAAYVRAISRATGRPASGVILRV